MQIQFIERDFQNIQDAKNVKSQGEMTSLWNTFKYVNISGMFNTVG